MVVAPSSFSVVVVVEAAVEVETSGLSETAATAAPAVVVVVEAVAAQS